MNIDEMMAAAPTAEEHRASVSAELDALEVIVQGFEALPAPARERIYNYLASRFPIQPKVHR